VDSKNRHRFGVAERIEAQEKTRTPILKIGKSGWITYLQFSGGAL